jgi:hypothetical protein
LTRSLPICDACPAEVAVLSLHGDDSASSYAGPAAAGASVIGDLADGASVGDVGSVMGGADSAQSTGIDNPQSAGCTVQLKSHGLVVK